MCIGSFLRKKRLTTEDTESHGDHGGGEEDEDGGWRLEDAEDGNSRTILYLPFSTLVFSSVVSVALRVLRGYSLFSIGRNARGSGPT
jgi:hypothetical protein